MAAHTDPLYMAARRALLDALFALAPHGKAVVVAGAQAVYLRTGEADLAIAPYTTDGDLAINPSLLGDDPALETAMTGAHFCLYARPEGHIEPGVWVTRAFINGREELISVDLIVPEAVASTTGRRGARLGPHGSRAARRAVGLEAALVDHTPMAVAALDPDDTRSIETEVAGVAALFVAKAHKIHDRVASDRNDRLDDKDAADVVRLMQATRPAETAARLTQLMDDPIAGEVTRQAPRHLTRLFGRRASRGVEMASRALQVAMDPATIAVICTAYIEALPTS